MMLHHLFRRKDVVHDKDFTLVELITIIAIIATLAGIATPLFFSYIDRVKVSKAKGEIRLLAREISFFGEEKGRYPVKLAELGLGGMLDPWGNPYQYLPVSGSPNGELRSFFAVVPVNQDFDLYSCGQDGRSQRPFTAKASRDDIVRANDGAYIGRVSAY